MHTGKHAPWIAVVSLFVTTASALAQTHGHGSHPPMPGQKLYFQCRVETDDDGEVGQVEVPIKLVMPTAPADLDQTVTLPPPLGKVKLTRYLPRADLEQNVVASESQTGKPAVRLAIKGPTQAYDLWLVADDPQRNSLISLIGTWRYMAVANAKDRDELFRQFKDELTRAPTLLVRRPDSDDEHTVSAEVGAEHTIAALGCQVRVRQFYPHFSYDRDSGKPVNRSTKRLNPAALLELRCGEKTEERWVFAKFPQFESSGGEAVPLAITLDCPLEKKTTTPDYAIVTVNRKRHEIWARHEGKTTTQPVATDQEVNVSGSQYKFRLANFIPSGRLTERYSPSAGRGGVTAIQFSMVDVSGKPSMTWLELGKQRAIPTGSGRLVVWFGPRQAPAPSGHKPPAKPKK